MQYKAIIFDLDGTLVPSVIEGMPSKKVIQAVQSLHGKIKLSSASGRSIINCRDIWKALNLNDPCIINGGSQIVDPLTEEILWEQKLPQGTIQKIIQACEGFTEKFGINGIRLHGKKDFNKIPSNAHIVVASGVKKEDEKEIIKRLKKIPDVNVVVCPSWTEGEYWDIHITHMLATKKHAIEKLMEIMQVKREETIGIGDGNNDLPLFESVGYKVAMGNAVDNLKAAADHITDTLENEGFAKFIEKELL